MPEFVRPQIRRSEYDDWQKTASSLGYGGGVRALWRLIRVLMAMAKESPAHFRKR
jgi:hypothetical protein